MSSRRLTPLFAIAALAAALLAPGGAQAAISHDAGGAPGTVQFDQGAYTAHENQGYLTITIQRTGDLSQTEQIRYGVKQQDGQSGIDFDAIPNTYITMAPGQSTYTFQVKIIDRNMNATPVHALAYMFGSDPDTIGANNNALVTILHDDPIEARDPTNPLGVATPVPGDVLAGTKFYVDPTSGAARAQQALAQSNPEWSNLLGDIASEPGAHRFYMWNMTGSVAGQVAHYLQGTQLQQPGTTVMLSTYSLIHDYCGYTATRAMQDRYDAWIKQVATGIGNYHVVFFLELDSLIAAPCLDSGQLAIRDAELQYAITALEADPHTVVYLDAGAADAVPADHMARLLRGAGVAQAQGFFLNSTHFDWTTTELHYGQQISRMLGGAHFVINTGENGRGPLVPADRVHQGNEVLCNPAGRGLGPLSLSQDIAQPTGYAGADGFLWFSNPGGSGGPCVAGAPPTGAYWPAYAAMLARNWVDKVTGPSFPLTGDGVAANRRLARDASQSRTAIRAAKRRRKHHVKRRHVTRRRHATKRR